MWNTSEVTATAETVFVVEGTFEAEPFIVRFKEADFQTNSTASTLPTNQSTATPADATSADIDSINKGLSSGAKAGIGVGATLGALFLVATGLAVFWFRKKRKGSNDEKAVNTPAWESGLHNTDASGELPAEPSRSELNNAHATSELPSSIAELNTEPTSPRELQASRYREVNSDDPLELGATSLLGR